MCRHVQFQSYGRQVAEISEHLRKNVHLHTVVPDELVELGSAAVEQWVAEKLWSTSRRASEKHRQLWEHS